MAIFCIVLTVYFWILFARVLASWFRVPPYGPAHTVVGWLYAVTDPVLRPFRSMLPPVRIGAMALDLSPIIVFIIIGIVRGVAC